jgi:hypothetical protein
MKKVMRQRNEIWVDEKGQTGGEIFAGIAAAIGALMNFMSHPITRFFTVESVLGLDSAVAFFVNWQGAIGASLGFMLKGFTGIDVPIETWELLIAYPCVELVIWMISNGRQ